MSHFICRGTSSNTQHTDSVSEGGGESSGAASADDQVGT
jgi:hypothetical protein